MIEPSSAPATSLPQNTLDLAEQFLLSRERARLSPKTIRWYRSTLTHFAKLHPVLPLEREPVEGFIGSYPGGERGHGAFRTLRTYYNWLVLQEIIRVEQNPIRKIRPPKRFASEKPALTVSQLKHLLEFPDFAPFTRTLIFFLASTGCRIGEAHSITPDGISEDRVRVNGKTGPRTVPIPPQLYPMLRELGAKCFQKVSTDQLSRYVATAFEQADLPGFSAHSLRHTFATLFDGSSQALKTICGWSSWAMVDRYTHRKTEKAITEYATHNPIGQIYGYPTETPQPQDSTKPFPPAPVASDASLLQAVINLACEVGQLRARLDALESASRLQSLRAEVRS